MPADSPSNLMPIGRFAASCRLSIKALRHYADQGLLVPDYVDPNTGYRYYTREQARTAVIIGMLRSLEISLPTIRELLRSDNATIGTILQAQEQRLIKELALKRQALASIKRLKQEGSLLPYEIAIRIEPEYRVIRHTIETTIERILTDSADAVYQLMDDLKAVNGDAPDLVMCINEVPKLGGAMEVHVCVGPTNPDECPPNSELVTLEGGPVAWCLHRGAYEELGVAYHSVFAWMQERGHEQSAAMREIYLNDPADTPVEQLMTEVMVPIRTGGR